MPLVARPGGLSDTVIDANEAALSAGVATGFQFTPGNGYAFLDTVRRAAAIYTHPQEWASLQKQGMKGDVSWDKSARKYVELYRLLLSRKAA